MGSGDAYIAFSGVNSWFSSIHNKWCRNPATIMHEVAHNLGLGHAYQNGIEYDDETTLMGFSYPETDGPFKCFNGQNMWHLGWFRSRTAIIDTRKISSPIATVNSFLRGSGNTQEQYIQNIRISKNKAQLVQLATFVDYDKTVDEQNVLIKIDDLFIVY